MSAAGRPASTPSIDYVRYGWAGALGVLLLLIARYGVNVPYMDEWEFVETYGRWRDGTFGWIDLWRQHNEHRVVFPRLIFVAFTALAGWNIKAELFFTVVLALTGALLLVSLLRRTVDASPVRGLLYLLVALQAFSLTQWVNWLWAWDMQWWVVSLSVIGCVWALHRAQRTAEGAGASAWSGAGIVALASACAVVATFSLASGMLVWVACLPMLLQPRMRRFLLAWCALAAVAIALYFVGYKAPSHHGSLLMGLSWLARLGQHIAYFGAASLPALPDLGLAVWIAFFGCGLRLAFADPEQRRRALPWFALGLFAFGTGALIAVGRVQMFGPEQGAESRYASISFLAVVATAVLLAQVLGGSTDRLRARAAALVVLGALALSVWASAQSFGRFQTRSGELQKGLECVRDVASASDACLQLVYPWPERVRKLVPILEKHRWPGLKRR